ncbi:MAG: lamin tail domain-containing protein, partial [Planctomycetes bacterium]|nr:lamin tail domain-containing protein [Planctomycetota bacterium]
VGESARWGDYRRDVHSWSSGPYELYTRNDHWLVEKRRLLDEYFPGRTAVVLQQFRADGLYPSIDAPVFAQRGGTVDPGFRLVMENPNGGGSLHYTLDGSDPRIYGTGGVNPLAFTYGGPIEIPASVAVRARILSGSTWSAMEEATFRVRGALDALRVTEIMYHPPATDSREGDEYEFIEIENAGSQTLDLTGVMLAGGVTFEFPLDFSLAPGRFAVVASDAAAFREKYPAAPGLAGEYRGRLSNSGDTFRIVGPEGDAVISVSYDDAPPWPHEPDGGGYSLVPKDPDAPGDPNLPQSWLTSVAAGGSPGSRDGEVIGGLQRPGDFNQDAAIDIGDAISLLGYLFGGGSASLPCGTDEGPGSGNRLLLDHNGDGQLDLGDAISLLGYLFQEGAPPALGADCTPIPGCPDRCAP